MNPNSPTAWDERFHSRHWHKAGGGVQSLSFYHHAFQELMQLPEIRRLIEWDRAPDGGVNVAKFRLHDYGCASGDGTALLQALFFSADVVGFDHSPKGVEEARRRWPTVDFKVGDIHDPEPAAIIWASHVLEHLADPAQAAARCIERSQAFIAAFPPVRGDEGEDSGAEHADAIPVSEWLPSLPPPAFRTSYNVVRISPEDQKALIEGNVLMVWG